MLTKKHSMHVAVAVCGLMASVTQANLLEIISTPQATSGPFRHNVFHTAGSNGGAGGSILGWFDLDTSQSSSYNTATGELDLHVNIYSDSGFGTLIGTAHGTSTLAGDPLATSEFNDFDNTPIGSINWNIELSSAGAFMTYMTDEFGAQPVGGWSDEVFYIDHNYVTSNAGHLANSWDPVGGFVTLWGADGTHNGNGFFDGSTLGTDVVFQVREVPLPASLALAAFGLSGVRVLRRRMR